MTDQFGRAIRYMRLSITDRCNLRCGYCMPERIKLIPEEYILTCGEIEEIAQAAAWLGIRKLKVTGGEPLARPGCAKLVGRLKQISGIEQVTMTTNGVLLSSFLPELMAAGLDAVNISLDSLNRGRFRLITGRDCLNQVMDGIWQAVQAGLRVKVNCVLQKGVNGDEWEDLADLSRKMPLDVRFIEMMPIGLGRSSIGVSNESLKEQLVRKYPGIEPDWNFHGNGPAVYYRIPGFLGSIGFISAIHGKFCGRCNRIRLTAQGLLKPCLCYEDTVDLREIVRQAEGMEGMAQKKRFSLLEGAIAGAVMGKPVSHCFESLQDITERKQMVSIGG